MDVWTKPVTVAAVEGGTNSIKSPFEALIILTERWPNMAGSRFVSARSKCRAAVAGMADAEEARQEFVEAAREANILLH